MKDTVVNLPDKELTKEQLYALYLSHKFAPTPSVPDLLCFENGLQTFFSKLRAKVIFHKLQYQPNAVNSSNTKHLNARSGQEKLFSTKCLIDALEITLDYNISTFTGQTFRQKKGAAMDAKIFVNICRLFH